jgi:hypothetical protein
MQQERDVIFLYILFPTNFNVNYILSSELSYILKYFNILRSYPNVIVKLINYAIATLFIYLTPSKSSVLLEMIRYSNPKTIFYE